MAYRCPHYQCEATSMEGLIQQVALSYLRHGYLWYVTGIVPERKEPAEIDGKILSKYDIRKDWRFIAHNKRRGLANLQYIRHGRFYIIMATKGFHEFKDREAKRIRDARQCPILIPRFAPSPIETRNKPNHRKRGCKAPTFDGYAVSYSRGGYLKKTPEEKVAYRQAMEQWQQQTLQGKRLPKPPKGTPDPKWHSCVEIERNTRSRLQAYFMEISNRRSPENLAYEFANTGFLPYAPVKRQLVRIIKDVNKARRTAGCSEQIPYRVVLGMKRKQISPFEVSDAVIFNSAA
jgi:hypothetical protein